MMNLTLTSNRRLLECLQQEDGTGHIPSSRRKASLHANDTFIVACYGARVRGGMTVRVACFDEDVQLAHVDDK
jgi:translation initiation factor IF-1